MSRRHYHGNYSIETKRTAFALLADGKHVTDVARLLKVPLDTVIGWRKRGLGYYERELRQPGPTKSPVPPDVIVEILRLYNVIERVGERLYIRPLFRVEDIARRFKIPRDTVEEIIRTAEAGS